MKATCAVAIAVATMLAALSVAVSPAYADWPGDPPKCKADAVKAGSVCMDKYEASVWQVPATNLGRQKQQRADREDSERHRDTGQSAGRWGDADQPVVELLAGIPGDVSGRTASGRRRCTPSPFPACTRPRA